MKEPYLMNKETGELQPYSVASREFYSEPRKWDESVFDEWIETELLAESELSAPDFATALAVG